MDDLHWASEKAWDTLQDLIVSSPDNMLYVGTYNDSCVTIDRTHSLSSIAKIKNEPRVQVHSIKLINLDSRSTDSLVRTTLASTGHTPFDKISPLHSWVHAATQGNPLFVVELLQCLQAKRLLAWDDTTGEWEWDATTTYDKLKAVHSLLDLYHAVLVEMPPKVQETLKMAAALGSSFDETLLKLLVWDTDRSVVANHLDLAVANGLFKKKGQHYTFANDAVTQAAYSLISAADRAFYHLKIGQRLWLDHQKERTGLDGLAFLIQQFKLAESVLQTEEDRRALAMICLEAGEHAAALHGFSTAWLSLCYGISVLSSLSSSTTHKKWGSKNYDLSLRLHNTAIEVCYCNSLFSELEQLIREVLEHARSLEDTMIARAMQIQALGTNQGKQLEAIEMGLETLMQLGVKLPSKRPSRLRIFLEFRRIMKLLRGMSDEALLGLPRMKDPAKLNAMRFMNHIVIHALYTNPGLTALIACRTVELTVKYGLSAIAAPAFILFGTVVSSIDALIDDGYRYGRLALRIYDMYPTEVWMARVSSGFYGSIFLRKHPVRDAIEPLRKAYRVGLRTGDIAFAVFNACCVCWNSIHLLPLPDLESQLRGLAKESEFLGQNLALSLLKPMWQATLNFMGRSEGDPKLIWGELIDADYAKALEGKNPKFLHWTQFYAMQLAYFFGDYDLAGQHADSCYQFLLDGRSNGAYTSACALFYLSLVRLALARKGRRRRKNLAFVRQHLKKLRIWAAHSPENYLGKQMLIQAELESLRGNHLNALTFYRSAILHCRDSKFSALEALANESLGRYFLERKDQASALPHMKAACNLYECWGGTAKVLHFKDEFGYLLSRKSIDGFI